MFFQEEEETLETALSLCPQRGRVKTKGKGCLQAKESGLIRNQPRWHLNFGLSPSRSEKKINFCFVSHPIFSVFFYGRPRLIRGHWLEVSGVCQLTRMALMNQYRDNVTSKLPFVCCHFLRLMLFECFFHIKFLPVIFLSFFLLFSLFFPSSFSSFLLFPRH